MFIFNNNNNINNKYNNNINKTISRINHNIINNNTPMKLVISEISLSGLHTIFFVLSSIIHCAGFDSHKNVASICPTIT